MTYPHSTLCLTLLAFLAFYASPVAAFGAGNIGKQQGQYIQHFWLTPCLASISKIEGHNWRQCVFSEPIVVLSTSHGALRHVSTFETFSSARYLL